MAISLVGRTVSTSTNTAATYSLNLTILTGGTESAPQPGDIVIVSANQAHTSSITQTATGNNSGAYNVVFTQLLSSSTTNTSVRAFYFIQGSTVDTQVTVNKIGTSQFGAASHAFVFRGVDPTNPLDVAAVTATATNTTVIDPPSVTPVTTGAWIIHGGSGSKNTTTANAPTNVDSDTYFYASQVGTSRQSGSYLAGNAWAGGTVNPGARNTMAVASGYSSASFSFVLRPSAAGATGQIKVYNGSSFVAKPVKVYNGSSWVTKPLKRWNGTSWVATGY